MAFVGNLFWFIFGGGAFACLGWLVLGLVLCCTIIGIPFGVAAFKIAGFAAFPFGRELVDAKMTGDKKIAGTGFANFLWIILAGLWLAISHVLLGMACFTSCVFLITIPVAIPSGLAHFKLAQVCFAPLGKRIVSKEMARAAKQRHVESVLDKKLGSQ